MLLRPASAQRVTREQSEAMNALGPEIKVELRENGVPDFVRGKISRRASADAKVAAKEALKQHKKLFRGAADDDFAANTTEKDVLKQEHVRLKQLYKGLEVVGGELIVHMDASSIVGISGRFVPEINVATSATVAAETLKANATRFVTADGGTNARIESVGNPVVFVDDAENAALAVPVQVSFYGIDGPQIDDVYVDATNGTVVGVRPRVMRAKTRRIYDGRQSCTALPGAFLYQEGGTSADATANAAYSNTGTTYDFYKSVFNRDSYDNAGGALVSTVHFQFQGSIGCSPNNAAWFDSYRQMAFGDGDGAVFSSLAEALDITAHELTHAVTTRTANLAYQGESGAVNEATSDILGESAQCWAGSGSCDYRIGEQAYTPGASGDALRYMFDPARDGSSADHYPTRQYASGCSPTNSNDYCGVHSNSGIANLAYYLLARGGSHPQGKTTVSVPGVGIAKAEQIWYRALTVYMTSSTSFEGARAATARAAADLYGGTCSATWQAVHKAWDAVAAPGPWSCSGASAPASCTASSSTTVAVCTPAAGATTPSPVHLTSVGGGSVNWMEVWVDGTKPYQTSGNKVDTYLTLGTGAKTITVVGKVGANVTDKKTVSITVASGASTPPPGSCAAASNTTAAICSPANGSATGSPVSISAKGGSSVNALEAWVDGVKVGQVSGTALTMSKALGAGSHRLTIYAKVGGTVTDKQVSYFTVP